MTPKIQQCAGFAIPPRQAATGGDLLSHAAPVAADFSICGFKRMTPNRIHQLVRREIDKLAPAIKAVAHIKVAADIADDLPQREADEERHDEQVKAIHHVVKMARAALHDFLGAQAGRAPRLRRVGSGTPASGTDDSLPYDPTGGDGLTRAKTALVAAADEADRLLDRIGDTDEAAVNQSANDMHHHTKTADAALEDYRAAVVDNPEGKARRQRARAIAAVTLNTFDPGKGII